MPVNRITVLFWTAGFVFCIGAVFHSRLILGLSFLLGGLSILLLISGAIHARNEQRRNSSCKTPND